MGEVSENEMFCYGISMGMALYQWKVLMAYERKIPLEINGEPYFIKDSGEQLRELINEICR